MKVKDVIEALATLNPEEEILALWWERDEYNAHWDVELSESQWSSVIDSRYIDSAISDVEECLSYAVEDALEEEDDDDDEDEA